MLSHPLCYLKQVLFEVRKSWIFKIFSLRPIFYRLEDTRLNALDLTKFRNQANYNFSEGVGDRFILTDLVIIDTVFRSSQSPVFLEITTIVFLTRKMSVTIPNKLLKKELTYTLNTFQGLFHADFCCGKDISCYILFSKIFETFRERCFQITNTFYFINSDFGLLLIKKYFQKHFAAISKVLGIISKFCF